MANMHFRVCLALGLVCLAANTIALAQYQPPSKRPATPPPPRPAAPNGPAVQLVAPTEDPTDPLSPNYKGNELRINASGAGNAPNGVPAGPNADPTIPSPEVRQMLEAGNANRPNNNSPAPPAATIPAISIKARIISRNRPPVAVIDVGGTPLTIHPGDSFSIGGGQGAGALRLKVTEMTQTEIRFEVENRRQILTLN